MKIFMSFNEGQLKQQICYTFTLLISYIIFNPFKMTAQFFKTASNFPNFNGSNAFSPKFNRPLVQNLESFACLI